MWWLEHQHYAIKHSTAHEAYDPFVLVSIVTLLKTQLTVSCLLCLALASLASTYSDFFSLELWKPHLRSQYSVTWLDSSHMLWTCAFFFIPDGNVSGCRWPGDIWSPSVLRHGEEEALGRFEATVEASGLVWDRSAAWVLHLDLHDEGGIGSSHPKHHWQWNYSEYGSAETTGLWHFAFSVFKCFHARSNVIAVISHLSGKNYCSYKLERTEKILQRKQN